MAKVKTLFTIIIGLNIGAFAQPVVGAISPGGTLNFTFRKTANSLPNNYDYRIAIAPNLGKFISEKYMLSGSFGYSIRHSSSNNGSTFNRSNINTFSVGVGLTRYAKLTDKFYFTLGAGLSPFLNLNYDYGLTTGISNSTNFGATVSIVPGLTYFLNEKWAVYTTFGSFSYTVQDFSAGTSHEVGLNLNGNNFYLGMRYFIQPKNKRESK